MYVHKAQEVTVPLAAWQHECTRNQQAQMVACIMSGSSSSSGVGTQGGDAAGDGCFCATCKLCQAELRRQQERQEQQQESDYSSSSSGSSAAPVDPADPFMWRRMLWGLLGSIKPSARRLWAAEKGMCPHADNKQ
jgi:hypothetical protein